MLKTRESPLGHPCMKLAVKEYSMVAFLDIEAAFNAPVATFSNPGTDVSIIRFVHDLLTKKRYRAKLYPEWWYTQADMFSPYHVISLFSLEEVNV